MLAAGVVPFSGAAMAADVVKPPPVAPAPIVVPAKAFDWSGHYIGIEGGWETGNAFTPPFSATEDGGLAGVYGGFNFQGSNNLVWGIDASINWDGAKGTANPPGGNSAGPTWKGMIRGRLGIAMNQVLLYATAGGAVMGYTANVTAAPSGSATPWGWTAGAGAEWAPHSNWTVRVDWAYQDYGTFTLSGPGPVGGTSVSVKANTFTAGVAMKF
jgi:outer membrane immunogenic protein